MTPNVVSKISEMEKSDELNTLRKDLQKSLWKNQAVFPRADAQLLSLGILVCFEVNLLYAQFFK